KADRALDASFFVAPGDVAGTRLEAVVTGQLEIPRVKSDLIATPLEDHRAEVVGEQMARHTAEVLEGAHVAAEEIGEGLVEEKLHVEQARVAQGQDESRQPALCAAETDRAEIGPVHLAGLARQAVQAQE